MKLPNFTTYIIYSPLILITLITYTQANNTLHSIESSPWSLKPSLQPPKDEFNITERPQSGPSKLASDFGGQKQLVALKQVLIRIKFNECCPTWKNLTASQEIQDELRRLNGRGKTLLKSSDLLNELRRTFANITYLSIDGQPGENELEKYYAFYDSVQYYLRLVKLAHSYLNATNPDGQDVTTSSDFNRIFKRQLKSVEFRANHDPILSSFINELTFDHDINDNLFEFNTKFDIYEDFIKYTQFGRYYARNISMVKESVLVFDQICSHLKTLVYPSNLTRPSKQYEIIRRLSFELYLIRNELTQHINVRILRNRKDVRRIFAELDDLVAKRSYIRLLGDEFSSSPPNFSSNVRQLTQLLELYTSNSLTQVSFYDQLSELPEEFIVLGSSIAHDYENREVPQFSRFDSDYFNWHSIGYRAQQSDANSTNESNEARKSNLSLLGRLFN